MFPAASPMLGLTWRLLRPRGPERLTLGREWGELGADFIFLAFS